MPRSQIWNRFCSKPNKTPKTFHTFPHYQALGPGQIRVILLQPGTEHAPIQCSLVECNLEDVRSTYDALSYVWGMPTDRNPTIEINGLRVSVGDSLFAALQELRTRQRKQYPIWVDAICINQNSTEEKSSQIQLMPEIYSFARNVQIWLGEATKASAAGIAALKYLIGTTNDKDLPIADWLKETPGSAWALGDILSRSWFERGWVIQESALAQSITMNVGPHTLSWQEKDTFRFLKRVKYLEVLPLWTELNGEREYATPIDLVNLREILELTVRRLSRSGEYGLNYKGNIDDREDLLDVVHRMRHRKVTNERDRIYSVMALADNGRGFPVDYMMSVEETFEQLYVHTRQQHADKW